MKVKELRELRAKKIADARAILNTAEAAKREPSAEERGQFESLMNEADGLEKRYLEVERLEAAEKSIATSQGRVTEPEQPGTVNETRADRRESPEYRSMFDTYLTGGFHAFGPAEHRALQADNDVVGGSLIAPKQMVNELIKFVDNYVLIRQLATKYTVTNSQSLGAPSLDNDPADADWTSELATGSEDSTMSFGGRELHPHPLAKRIKVSNKLLRLAALGAENIVRDRLAYKFAVAFEKACLTGSGANQPLGIFTASANGISTGRDVSTGNSTTAIGADGLLEAYYSLKQPYQNSASLRWLFHRDGVKQIMKLKDGDGQYIWRPGLMAGQPDLLLGKPVLMSEYAPNTFTTGKYVGAIGDFSKYWIADAVDLTIQRLVELYAENNQIGFIGRMESDGMPVLEEAFARVTLA